MISLYKIYDLTPGGYTITAQYNDPFTNTTVQSNTVTLKVTQ